MNLLIERGKNDNYPAVYAFNTFFYPKLASTGYSTLKRWTRKVFNTNDKYIGINYLIPAIEIVLH